MSRAGWGGVERIKRAPLIAHRRSHAHAPTCDMCSHKYRRVHRVAHFARSSSSPASTSPGSGGSLPPVGPRRSATLASDAVRLPTGFSFVLPSGLLGMASYRAASLTKPRNVVPRVGLGHLDVTIQNAAEHGDRDAQYVVQQLGRVLRRPEQVPARQDQAGLGVTHHLERDGRGPPNQAERGEVGPERDEASEQHQKHNVASTRPLARHKRQSGAALGRRLRAQGRRQPDAQILERHRCGERLHRLPEGDGRLQLHGAHLKLLLLGPLPDLEDSRRQHREHPQHEARGIELDIGDGGHRQAKQKDQQRQLHAPRGMRIVEEGLRGTRHAGAALSRAGTPDGVNGWKRAKRSSEGERAGVGAHAPERRGCTARRPAS
eukprot:scaffold3785_cov115-Isochrysis_galbana.AAC.4